VIDCEDALEMTASAAFLACETDARAPPAREDGFFRRRSPPRRVARLT